MEDIREKSISPKFNTVLFYTLIRWTKLIRMLATRRPMIIYAERLSKNSKAFRNFSRGINSQATLSGYTNYLITFMEFHNLGEDYDGLVKKTTAEIDELIM